MQSYLPRCVLAAVVPAPTNVPHVPAERTTGTGTGPDAQRAGRRGQRAQRAPPTSRAQHTCDAAYAARHAAAPALPQYAAASAS